MSKLNKILLFVNAAVVIVIVMVIIIVAIANAWTNPTANPPSGSGTLAGGINSGAILAHAQSTCPSGWLAANGSNVSRTTYSALFTAISTMYGVGDGSTTFTLPDYRGYFLRGWANSSTIDPDRASRTNRGDGTTGDNVGTKQTDAFKAHTHPSSAAASFQTRDLYDVPAVGNAADDGSATGSAGGSETRPANIYVLYCIKT